jgi:hypothetical protein
MTIRQLKKMVLRLSPILLQLQLNSLAGDLQY